MEDPLLEGCLAKLDRAEEHLRDFDAAVLDYLRTEPYGLRGEVDRPAGRYSVRISVKSRPPLRVGLLVGDAVQNLRASLDHLVCRLAELNGARDIGRNQFPIFSERPSGRRAEGWRRMLAGVHPEPAALIESLQPYNRPSGVELSKHSLWIVQQLSNEDKHRVVPRALARVLDPDSSPFDAVPTLEALTDVGEIGEIECGSLGPDEAEAELYGAPIEILGPKPQLKLQGALPIELVVGRDRISNRRLESAAGKVRRLVESFIPLFAGPPLKPDASES